MKSILIISQIIPFPLNEGGKVAQYFFVEQLKEKYSITYILSITSNKELEYAKQLQQLHQNIQFKLYINISTDSLKNIPTGYLKRLLYILKNTLKRDKSKYEYRFQIHPIEKSYFDFIQDCLSSQKYDIVQVEFPWALNIAPLLPKSSTKVFIQHEPQSKRYINSFPQPTKYQKYIADLILNSELSCMKHFDKAVVFNQQDYQVYENRFENLVISPFGIPEKLKVKHSPSATFQKLLFLGSEFHEPNKKGLLDFLDNYYLPNQHSVEYPVYITGFWSKEVRKKYSNNKKVNFLGYVEDVEQYYDHSILIVPIISGGGIRVKILQAFENHIPVISTFFAAESLYNDNQKDHLLLYNNIDDFNYLLPHIYNFKYMAQLAVKAKKYVSENFNAKKLTEIRESLY